MEVLNLNINPDISDAGAAKLLDCLGNVKVLVLYACNVSDGMKRKLREREIEGTRKLRERGFVFEKQSFMDECTGKISKSNFKMFANETRLPI